MTGREWWAALAAAALACGAVGFTVGAHLGGGGERVYACRTPTITSRIVSPNFGVTRERHAGYPDCKRVK